MDEKKEINFKIGDPLPYELVLKGGKIRFPAGCKVTRDILRMLKEGHITQVEVDWTISEDLNLDLFEEKIPETPESLRLKNVRVAKRTREYLSSITDNPADPFNKLRESIKCLWDDPTHKIDVTETTNRIVEWIDDTSDIGKTIATIGWNTRADEFFHPHQIDTSRLATWLGMKLNLAQDEILNLAIAGLFHDVGELYINHLSLTKAGKLEQSEINRLREHPRKSIEWLKRSGFDSELLHRIVLRHHERFDGSGYPFNIRGKFLELIDSVFALADVYTALISIRPHRIAMHKRQAIRLILEQKGKWFPENIVEGFIKIMGLYPPGSIVELKSGNIALILEPSSTDKWRALKFDMQSLDVKSEIIDLNSLKTDYIAKEISI